MTAYLFVKYLHYIFIFGVVSSVVAEHLLYKPEMTRREIKRMSVIDGIYGASAILVVAMGLILWLGVGKPAEFYSKNPLFHIKFTLFIVIGVLSIVPTIFFMKNRKGDPDELVAVPKKIIMMIRLELLLLFLMPGLAVLIAQGMGA